MTRTLSVNEKSSSRGTMRKSTRHRRAKSEMGASTQINSSPVVGRIISTGIPNENSEDRPHDADLLDTPMHIPYLTNGEQNSLENACDYCGVYTGDKNYPCSVCGLVFHKSCVNKLYIKNNQGISLAMAGYRIGDDFWTCHNCEDLPALLTVEEIKYLTETLDKYGMKKDTSVTHANYLRYRRGLHNDVYGEDMKPEEMRKTMQHFNHIDMEETGQIYWKDFLNNETVRILQQRSQNKLLHLLKPREIDELRKVFKSVDTKCQGHVPKTSARKAFIQWIGAKKKISTTPKERQSFKDKKKERTKNNKTSTMEDKENIKWDQFVKDYALSIIASRTNTTGFLFTEDYVHLATDYFQISQDNDKDHINK